MDDFGDRELQEKIADHIMLMLVQARPVDAFAVLECCVVETIARVASDEANGLAALAAINGDITEGIRLAFAGGSRA